MVLELDNSLRRIHPRPPEGQEPGRIAADHVHNSWYVRSSSPGQPRGTVYDVIVWLADWVIVGEKIFPELELTHLDGHKASKPVRYVG
jgi:hypothetical protein